VPLPPAAVLNISPDYCLRIALLLVAVLVLLHIGGLVATLNFGHNRLGGLVPLFSLTMEANIPTWYQSMALFLCGALCGAVALAERNRRSGLAFFWTLLAAAFVFLSADEVALIHEKLNNLPKLLPGMKRLMGQQVWAMIYGTSALAGLFFVWRYLRKLPGRTRRLILLAGATYVFAAVGLELVAFWYRRTLLTQDAWAYRALETAEESLEMLAIALMIYTVLDYAAKSFQTALFGFRVQFAQRHDALATASAPSNPAQATAGDFQTKKRFTHQAAHRSQ
jgi:hypothetical protein